ncbi:ABC transporter substrate-binding protein [Rhodococcus sp. MS16]|uniref:ABC transporter substrate-binding protein n=1 Tax=unclassified Rhodococcus (in: high G+C Gram-positive bacteria) TaxID=192944 RepID=UPI0011446620|nr:MULTISPECIES: ABC transporter substrate-binding protein [unclassified Rhodococcus (in: high G+C Gram-positive bacteria)]NRI68677.1 ABC transporter substrate-binding protein [Rhodococcus sp. MS16]ROZ50391.1 ABC transporter substrate-binding protein [Rhodococcus sp. WS3]
MTIRTRTKSLAALLGIALLATVTACSSTSEATEGTSASLVPLTVGAPWNGAAGKSPTDTTSFGYAVHEGLAQPILEKYGFEYKAFVGFNNGPPVVQALQTGDVQVGLIGDTPAVQAKASGIDVPALVIDKPASDIWFLGREGGVSKIEDLAGKKVGLQFGSNFDKYGRAVLERAGVADQVELVNLLFADALPALQRGDIDAVPLPATTAGIWRKQINFPILSKASVDDPDLLATSVALTSRETFAANPELAKAVWEVIQAGDKAIDANHDGYAQFVFDATGSPVDVVKEATLWNFQSEPVDPDGLNTVRSTLDFLVKSGKAPNAFDVTTWAVS